MDQLLFKGNKLSKKQIKKCCAKLSSGHILRITQNFGNGFGFEEYNNKKDARTELERLLEQFKNEAENLRAQKLFCTKSVEIELVENMENLYCV